MYIYIYIRFSTIFERFSIISLRYKLRNNTNIDLYLPKKYFYEVF